MNFSTGFLLIIGVLAAILYVPLDFWAYVGLIAGPVLTLSLAMGLKDV